MVGWVSRTALGSPSLVTTTWRTRSLSSVGVPKESEAFPLSNESSSCLLLVEREPMLTAMGCDGDCTDLIVQPCGISMSMVNVNPCGRVEIVPCRVDCSP